MGQLGRSKEGYYPDLALGDAIDLIRQITEVGGRISQTGLAKIVGIDPRGQGLATRVRDLKAYGLIEGNGELQVTQLGGEIVAGDTSKAWEAFMNIPLYAKLHERLKGKEPPDKVVLQNILYEITKADTGSISRRLNRIKTSYVEAIPYFSGKMQEAVSLSSIPPSRPFSPRPMNFLPMDSNFLLFDKDEKVFISIDSMDTLKLAQMHLQNAEKRFDKSGREQTDTPKT